MKRKLIKIMAAFTLFFMSTVIYGQTPPPLGVSADFVLFSGSGAILNVGVSQITGNVGTNLGSSTGFGNINGQMHDQDGVSAAAAFDLNIAYLNIGAQAATMFPGILLGGGQVLTPAVFNIPAVAVLDGNLVLDGLGDPNACFIFQLDAAFSANPGASVQLINGTKACNVFWRIDGATSLAAGVTFKGNIICNGAIQLAAGDDLEGRALSMVGAVTVTGVSAGTPIGCGSPVLMGPLMPAIGSLECYALLTADGALTNTGVSKITGDVGTNNGPVTGFIPLDVIGMIHAVPDASTALASADLGILYTYLNSLSEDIELLYPAQFGNSQVLTPHTYLLNAATTFTDTIFLDAQGSPDAVFVIQVNGAFMTSTYSNVVLLGGAQSSNVFWKMEGAVDINDYSIFRGTIVANNGAISMFVGDTLDGRALSTTGAISINSVGSIVINSVPPGITPNDTLDFCQGGSVILTADPSTSYLWSNGAITQSITVISSGNYYVISPSACGANDTSAVITVTVNPSPIPIITPDGPTNFCVGDSVMLTANNSASYLWSNGEITQSIMVYASENFDVTLEDVPGCSSTSSITVVTVNPLPIATISTGGSTTFCQGDSVMLTANLSSIYLWSNGSTTQSIYADVAGNYLVYITDINGCSDSSTTTVVIVNPAPIATISSSGTTTFCPGGSVTLTSSLGNSYLWSTGETTQSIVVDSSGNYTVTVSDLILCSATSLVTVVTVDQTPIAAFTSNLTGLLTYSFTDASTSATNYDWNFGDGQSSTLTNPTNTYALAGSYTVTLIVSNTCSSDTATQVIDAISDYEFFNGFSPNSDGENDTWNIPMLDLYSDNTVTIINRWGSEVWFAEDYNNTTVVWNGENMKGDELPDGTYYYIITYNNNDKQGWVYVKR